MLKIARHIRELDNTNKVTSVELRDFPQLTEIFTDPGEVDPIELANNETTLTENP